MSPTALTVAVDSTANIKDRDKTTFPRIILLGPGKGRADINIDHPTEKINRTRSELLFYFYFVTCYLLFSSQLRGAAHRRPATMLALMALSTLAALLFVYLFMPALWLSIMSVDESLDAHEAGLALVASRTSWFVLSYSPHLTDNRRQPFPRNGPSS